MTITTTEAPKQGDEGHFIRSLSWTSAFWIAAGVPPLVLFSSGGIPGMTGKVAFVVWIVSMMMGFLQSFTYAEMAGMLGNKSGGALVSGAMARLRYAKPVPPCRSCATGVSGRRFCHWAARLPWTIS